MSKNGQHPLRFGFHRPAPDQTQSSFKFSGFNVYLFLTSLAFIILGGAYLLVNFTPFSSWVKPDETYENKQLSVIRDRLATMQDRIDVQSKYINTLQRRLSGEEIEEETTGINIDSSTTEPTVAQRIALDDSLRMRVQRSNLNVPVRTPVMLQVSEPQKLEDEYLIPPIRGVVRKSFSLADKHFGVDILAPENSAVQCVLDGLVIESDWTLEGGNTIIIQHEHNLISVYKHNSALLKKRGQLVKTGEAIAIIGNTGLHTDGPHVHFELWYNGEQVDPESYIALDREVQ